MTYSQSRFSQFIVAGLAVIFSAPVFAKELVFGTPPTQSPEVTARIFQPLADYLGKVSGHKIVVKPAKNFHEYTRKMRNDEYDLILDGPHFIKYRIDKMGHNVLVKQPGDLQFAVVVAADSPVSDYNNLVGKRVCSPGVPHLGTLTFLDLYTSPIRQPVLRPVQSFKDAIECVRGGKATAAVVRDKFWLKKVKNKQGLKVIYVTKTKMPARGLTVNNKTVDKVTQQRIMSALLGTKSQELVQQALSTVGGKRFVKADHNEYARQEELLAQVWGFHI